MCVSDDHAVRLWIIFILLLHMLGIKAKEMQILKF